MRGSEIGREFLDKNVNVGPTSASAKLRAQPRMGELGPISEFATSLVYRSTLHLEKPVREPKPLLTN